MRANGQVIGNERIMISHIHQLELFVLVGVEVVTVGVTAGATTLRTTVSTLVLVL